MKGYTKLGLIRYYCRYKGIPCKTEGSYRIEIFGKWYDVSFFTEAEMIRMVDRLHAQHIYGEEEAV